MLLLAEATWTDVRDLLAARPDTILLLPVGAVEAHGPHLPLTTDVIIAEALARRVADSLATRSLALAPAVSYSLTSYAGRFPGTIGISGETARAHLRELFAGCGFQRICVVNAHLEPEHVKGLKAAAVDSGTNVIVPDTTRRAFREAYQAAYGRSISHADAYETSLILAEKPELVRDRAALPPNPADLVAAMKAGKRTFGEAGGPDAYFGDPAAATPAEGEWLYARLVEIVVEAVNAAW